MKPTPEETEIRGFWIDLGSGMTPDSNWERVTALVDSYFEPLGNDGSSFRDPADGRIWELVRPMPNLKNGGPPLLRCCI
jgi:hypothetical protein